MKYLNKANMFIGLNCLYMFLKARESSSLTGFLLTIIFVISAIYYIRVSLKKQPELLKWLSILLGMFLVYGILYIIFGSSIQDESGNLINRSDYIKKIGASLFLVYPCYVFSIRQQITPKTILLWCPIFILISIFSFVQHYNNLLQLAIEKGAAGTEFTNNKGYLFVALLPLMFIKQKQIILQYLAVACCAVFIVASVKRGAILIGSISIAYFLYNNIKNSPHKIKKRVFWITCLGVIVAGYFISDFISNSEYILYRFNNTLDGNMSGRDKIYKSIWETYLNSNIINFIFGYGADSSIRFTGLYAHSDWFEILINQGIFGISIYICFFYVLFKTWQKNYRDPNIGLCLGGLFIVIFLRTFFSMSYTEYPIYQNIALGYCLSIIAQNQTKCQTS